VLALDTYLAASKCRVAFMAAPVDTHPYRLLNAKCLRVWFIRKRLDGDGESLSHLLVPFCFNLRAHHPLCSLRDLPRRLCSGDGFGFWFAKDISKSRVMVVEHTLGQKPTSTSQRRTVSWIHHSASIPSSFSSTTCSLPSPSSPPDRRSPAYSWLRWN